ncbi:MAG: NAD-dependent epimerase/dehydratase family protein [Thermodesulfobacteriota bacterium]
MKALVTGGGGFLGRAIIARLLERQTEVASLARSHYPDLERPGVMVRRGDVADPEAVAAAAEGCDVVFHTAAKAGAWGPYQEYFRTNVLGTRNVIEACRRQGVTRLIYTSSPSVVHDGGDLKGVDESRPYPPKFQAHYPATKAEAERLVLSANGDSLATVALRPHLIWGPGDNHLIPRIIARAKAGRLVKIKGGPYLVDSVYIDNAADAHLLAAERLSPRSPIAGRAYFISQGEPLGVDRLVDLILSAAGLPPVNRGLSPGTAYAVGWLFEMLYTLLPLSGEPPLTRFVANQLATSHWFDLTAARRDLGYSPTVSIAEGIERLKLHLSGR